MAGKITGLKRRGCFDPDCIHCAMIKARGKALGWNNIFITVTAAERDIIAQTPGLQALTDRIHNAQFSCGGK
jgi:hypothetical protein